MLNNNSEGIKTLVTEVLNKLFKGTGTTSGLVLTALLFTGGSEGVFQVFKKYKIWGTETGQE